MGFALAALGVLVLNLSPVGEQGTNSAALQISDTLGSALTVGVAGAIITHSTHLSTGLGIAGALTILIAGVGVVAALRVEIPK
jgi:hypothetical protein